MPGSDREIILAHVGAAMAAAAAPLPWLDVASVTAIQIALVRRLAARHAVAYDPLRARAAVLSLAGATLARLAASALKLVPGAGSLAGGAAQVTLSGVATYAIGETCRGHFAAQGTLADADPDALARRYREAAERGREVVRRLRRQRRDAAERAAHDERAERAERLRRLERSGILTRGELDVLLDALAREAEPEPEPG